MKSQTEMQLDAATTLPVETARNRVTVAEEQKVQTAVQDGRSEVDARLFASYKAEMKRHSRRIRRAMQAGVGIAVGMTLVDMVAILIAAQAETEYPPAIVKTCIGLLLLGGGLLLMCAAAAIDAVWQRYRCRTEFVATALYQGNACMVGPLIEMLAQPRTRLSAVKSLVELLPRLSADDGYFLNAEQRQTLCHVLRNGGREEHRLRLAILRALAQIGDSSALTLVERIADSPAGTWRQRELKEEAQRCLPTLRHRTQHETASRTLLRAANVTDAGKSLLRAATPNIVPPSDQLLRPTETQG
jgi:hypothetical protein